jgi:hypothetical protein
MSRRRGQNGHIEKSGKWFVVRYWKDIAGQEKRQHVRERICSVSGKGSMTDSQRERRAKEIVQQSGADTVEHFERVVLSRTGVAFKEQAKVWYDMMSSRKSKPVRPSTPPHGTASFATSMSTSAICRWGPWWTTRRPCGILSKRCTAKEGSPRRFATTCR